MTLPQVRSLFMVALTVCAAYNVLLVGFLLGAGMRIDPQRWEAYQYLLVALDLASICVFELAFGVVPVVAVLALTRARLRPWPAAPVLVVGALGGTLPLLYVNGWGAVAGAIAGLSFAGYLYHRFGRVASINDPTTAA